MSGRGRGRSEGGRGRNSGRGGRSEGRGRGGRSDSARDGGRFDSGRGGGGRYESGRGGGRGRESGGGGRGRSGGGRGGRGPEPPCPPTALSNILPCSTSPNLHFYVYGIDCSDKNGKPIDSRSRRASLFYLGMGHGNFTHEKSLLARACQQYGEGRKLEDYKNEWGRVLYFQNSVVFSRDPLPIDLSEGKQVVLVGGGDGPASDDGDGMVITDMTCYSSPVELVGQRTATLRTAPQAADELNLELRCGGTEGAPCTKTFIDEGALKRHCAQTGHSLVIVGDNVKGGQVKVANTEIFLQYANVVLKRALSERLMPW